MIARFPPLRIGEQSCRPPLCEPTAAALLGALLAPDSDHARQSLAESIALDPALALWAALGHAADEAEDARPPSIRELAAWLSKCLGRLIQCVPGAEASSESAPTAAALAKLAAADLAAALAAIGKGNPLDEPRYLAELLRSSAVRWLELGGCSEASAASIPGWLGAALRAKTSNGAATLPRAARRTTKAGRPAKSAPPRHRDKKYPAGSPAEKARQRWLTASGFAAQNFAAVAARLAQLQALEADFDERLEAEKLEALAEFAAGAGHEINNPLAVISGRAQLFLRQEQDPERRRELAVINAQARRVHEMIADLMLFARPPEPRLAACDIVELIDTIAAELEARAAEAGVALSIHLADELPTMHADATQLEVALRAVCENALDALAGRESGRIEITAGEARASRDDATNPENSPPDRGGGRGGSKRSAANSAESTLAITIRDNGPGMPAEVRRHAFDPFYSGRGAGRGLGNGLSKCWRIVTAHGGRVEIDTHNTGTMVTLLLPLRVALTTLRPS